MNNYFKNIIEDEKWYDWKWQIANRLSDISNIEQITNLSPSEKDAISKGSNFSIGITPYYSQHIENSALRKTIIPQFEECKLHQGEWDDPLGEENHRVTNHLIHTYPDKVLFLATVFCSTYCRYCTRSRMVGKPQDNRSNYEDTYRYIEEHKEIRDVLISGGDPLTLTDGALEKILIRLRSIPHIKLIRIGSKVPAVLPMRITPNLAKLLRRYRVWLSLHFIHEAELTKETSNACVLLSEHGVPMFSQTVLLKGVNDTSSDLIKLFYGLIECDVKPYYLLQCDPVKGSIHFRTSISKGIDLIKSLHGNISGLAVPHYVIDAPGGGGKVPIIHPGQISRDGNDALFKNHEGKIYRYPDPIEIQNNSGL